MDTTTENPVTSSVDATATAPAVAADSTMADAPVASGKACYNCM